MDPKNYRYQSHFARRFVEHGRIEGKVDAVLMVLDRRNFDVPDAFLAEIRACTDIVQLDTWLLYAVTADTIDEVIAEPSEDG